jgi:preprotein translocase subunit YajC
LGAKPRPHRSEEQKEKQMADDLKAGDKVKWKSHGGEAHGKVVRKQTSETQIKGHKVAASEDNPQFIVETEEGKRAAHKPDALTRE